VSRPLRTAGALIALALAVTLAGVPQSTAAPRPATAATPRANHVLESRVIGKSVRGRPITAWHMDDTADGKRKGPTVVLVATMHGNEGAPRQILRSLRGGSAIHGVDLWLVPAYNPDGLAAHTRRNAHGVDLNRNYPYHWVDLDGNYESGSHPASEPETRAMMRFLTDIRPDYVLSFHQPLHGVDTDNKRPAFSRRVAHTLQLPATTLDCGGVCHGTMTGWFNDRFKGFALTVEYGAHPPAKLMRVTAPRQVLSLFHAFAGNSTLQR
jgi:murein peptide amidase A